MLFMILFFFFFNFLEKVLWKIFFLASNGASVNSRIKSGLIPLLKEDYEWTMKELFE